MEKKKEKWSSFTLNFMKPAALIFLIRNKKADILDYLAVDPTIRGHRIGSRILTWLQEVRKHPFIVEYRKHQGADNRRSCAQKAVLSFFFHERLQDYDYALWRADGTVKLASTGAL